MKWPITSRSTLQQGLYQYDAIGRLQESQLSLAQAQAKGTQGQYEPPEIGRYIKLGPLGTALLPTETPRALLIDEIDKSDLDLPSDLLHVFEDGEYSIPELERLPEEQKIISVKDYDGNEAIIRQGRVPCTAFPFVVLTSNGDREFPAPFLRRCLQYKMAAPDETKLKEIVRAHFAGQLPAHSEEIVTRFLQTKQEKGLLATDQLLNAICLVQNITEAKERDALVERVFTELSKHW